MLIMEETACVGAGATLISLGTNGSLARETLLRWSESSAAEPLVDSVLEPWMLTHSYRPAPA